MKDFVAYSYNSINNGTERGSCQDYDTRHKIDVQLLSVETALSGEYEQNLVIVAAQNIREKILIPQKLDEELSIQHYCIVERVARSREVGELVSGKNSLLDILQTDKKATIFYIMQNILKKELLIQQELREAGSNRSLYHIPSRFIDFKNNLQMLLTRAITFLKKKENCTAILSEMKQAIGGEASTAKRMLTHHEFNTNIEKFEAPYRFYYPNATPKQWQTKKAKTEKSLLLVRLRDPTVEVYDLFKSKDTEEDNEDGFLDTGNQIFGESLLRQVYIYLEMRRDAGASQTEIARHFGLAKMNARLLYRNILRLDCADTFMVDEGRQRTQKLVLKKYSLQNQQNVIQDPIPSTSSEIEPTQVSSVSSGEISNILSIPDEDIEIVESAPLTDPTGLDLTGISAEIEFIDEIPNTSEKVEGIMAQFDRNQLSARVVKRLQIILKVTQIRRIVNCTSLLKTIQVHEKRAAYGNSCDRRSMFRLINRLAVDNLLRLIEVKIIFEEQLHSFKFSCVPDIQLGDETVERTVDMIKARFAMKDAVKKHPTLSITGLKGRRRVDTGHYKPPVELSMAPKNIRMQNLHEFLFHVIYGMNPDTEPLPQKPVLVQWLAENPDVDPKTVDKLPDIYYTPLCWRSFLAPVKSENGMYFLPELIQSLPISIFLTLTNVDHSIPELQALLMHPILKHLPLKYTPNVVRALLGKFENYLTKNIL